MSRQNDLVGESREEFVIDRERLMARNELFECVDGYRPAEHDWCRPVRIAALERLKAEHGIVAAMPSEPRSRAVGGPTIRPAPKDPSTPSS